MNRLTVISVFLFSIFFLACSFPAEAQLLPQMITVQNADFDIIGYINTDGSVMDANFNLAGFIRPEGRIEGANGMSIGYYDGHRFTDMNMYNMAYFDGSRVENSSFYTIGHVGFGTIEGQDFSIVGYFMGDTGGQEWVIAAFCLYYTNVFHYRPLEAEKPEKPEEPEDSEEVALSNLKEYRIFGDIELSDGKNIKVELFSSIAPYSCLRFITLAEEDFYDDLEFFDVKEGAYVRSGCPNNDGTGKSEYKDLTPEVCEEISLQDSPLLIMYQGKTGKDELNCQFLITMTPMRDLKTSNYTIFGKVIDGIDVVRSLKGGETIKTIKIVEEENED